MLHNLNLFRFIAIGQSQSFHPKSQSQDHHGFGAKFRATYLENDIELVFHAHQSIMKFSLLVQICLCVMVALASLPPSASSNEKSASQVVEKTNLSEPPTEKAKFLTPKQIPKLPKQREQRHLSIQKELPAEEEDVEAVIGESAPKVTHHGDAVVSYPEFLEPVEIPQDEESFNQVAKVQMEAFTDDPYYIYFYPDRQRRREYLMNARMKYLRDFKAVSINPKDLQESWQWVLYNDDEDGENDECPMAGTMLTKLMPKAKSCNNTCIEC